MSGFYRTRIGPLNFASALINGGNANHGVARPIWDYRNGAGYASSIGGNVFASAFPRFDTANSFAANLLPASSVTLTSDEANIRLLAGIKNGDTYIDAILRTQEYELWDGNALSSSDLATCLFPAAQAGAGLTGKYLLLEIGRVIDGQRTILASAKVISNDYYNTFYDGGLNPYGLSYALSLSIVDQGAAEDVLVVAMLRADRQRRYSEAEQQAASHHWLSASTARHGVGEHCGIGKATNAGTYYTGVMFRDIQSPVLVPINNKHEHDAQVFGGVLQQKITLSGADPDYLAVRVDDNEAGVFPADMLPSMFEIKPVFVGGQVDERLPNGEPFTRLAASDYRTNVGGVKAALTPGTLLSQSVLAPPAAGFPSWSNVEQESPPHLDVVLSLGQGGFDFGQWLPQSVRCYQQSNGVGYGATDCMYVGEFSSHAAARAISAELYGQAEQTMSTSGSIAVLVSPSYGPRLYWDGTKWTQRHRYAAMFSIRLLFDYAQSTHQRIGGSFTFGERGVGVVTLKITWQSGDGVNVSGSTTEGIYYTKQLPASGLIPSGIQGSDHRIVSSRQSFESSQWVAGEVNQLPSNCLFPGFSFG
jgi:hypothetical protein